MWTAEMSSGKDKPNAVTDRAIFAISSFSGFLQATSELLDLRYLLLHSLLHPLQALQSNLFHLFPLNMPGRKSFNAETDIPDLSGKVIMVTGGT